MCLAGGGYRASVRHALELQDEELSRWVSGNCSSCDSPSGVDSIHTHAEKISRYRNQYPTCCMQSRFDKRGPLDMYSDPARRAPPIAPPPYRVSRNLSHLIAVCVQFASLLHCLDRPGEMCDWDDEEAKARLAYVILFNRQRRVGLPV